MDVAVGYIRVSTAGQAEEGVSLDAQRKRERFKDRILVIDDENPIAMFVAGWAGALDFAH